MLHVQVRKVLWKLFEIWSTPQAAACAEPAVLAKVEKLLQPLGLFRKRTVAIKRLSQEYLETQVGSAPHRCADMDGVSLCAQQQVWQAAAAYSLTSTLRCCQAVGQQLRTCTVQCAGRSAHAHALDATAAS